MTAGASGAGTSLRDVRRFAVKQRFVLAKRYEIRAVDGAGTDGDLLALAQVKVLTVKERVTFYADDSRSAEVFSFAARSLFDLGATYDVTAPGGEGLGTVRKEFGFTVTGARWTLEAPGVTGTGQARSMGVSLLMGRKNPAFHLDMVDDAERPVLSIERAHGVRDRFIVDLHDGRVDGRVAAALGVALDMDREKRSNASS